VPYVARRVGAGLGDGGWVAPDRGRGPAARHQAEQEHATGEAHGDAAAQEGGRIGAGRRRHDVGVERLDRRGWH
jgi:hypothetical protein